MNLPSYIHGALDTLSLQAKDDAKSLGILLAAAVGVAYISSYALSFGKMLFDLARSGDSLNKYGARKGHWAIVTGCTAGIGREFALQLSKAGFKVLLVSRTESSLKQLAGELKNPSQIHAIDFGSASISDYEELNKTISSLDGPVGVLVNNVGVSHSMPVMFHECPDSEMEVTLEINARATMRVTKAVLPSMISSRRGLVLNIGSFASLTSSPLLAPYAGSKAFLYTWSRALGSEYESYGIKVSLINTYFVVSSLSKIRKPNLLTPLPKAYVKSVLSHIGLRCGATDHPYVSTPYWSHAIAHWLVDHVGTEQFWISYTRRLHVDIRRRALKKQQRTAAGGASSSKVE